MLQEDTGENDWEAVFKSITAENFLEFKKRYKSSSSNALVKEWGELKYVSTSKSRSETAENQE